MKHILIILIAFFSLLGTAYAQLGPDLPPVDINNPSGANTVDLPPTNINNPASANTVDLPPTDINHPAGISRPGPGPQPNTTQPITATGSFLNISLPANHGLPGNDGLKPMLQSLLQNALYFVGLIGILGLLYASIQLWLSHGKADSIGSAKANIFNIILGLAIVLLAWTGVTVVLRFLGF